MIIRPEQWRAQPWKNGRGITREVLRVPDVDDYDLRISVAEVTESGPFSTFPGYRRWSLCLAGAIELAGRPLAGLREVPGDETLDAVVVAPATLLNVIGRGIEVGVGDADGVDVVFDLATRETRVGRGAARGQVLWVRRA